MEDGASTNATTAYRLATVTIRSLAGMFVSILIGSDYYQDVPHMDEPLRLPDDDYLRGPAVRSLSIQE
jgi:hypothetical protein